MRRKLSGPEGVRTVIGMDRHPNNRCRGMVTVGYLRADVVEGMCNFGVAESGGSPNAARDTRIAHFFRARCFVEIFNPSGEEVFAGQIFWDRDIEYKVLYPRGAMSLRDWFDASTSNSPHIVRMTYPTAKYRE